MGCLLLKTAARGGCPLELVKTTFTRVTRHDRGRGLRSQSGHRPPHPLGTPLDQATRDSWPQTHEEHQGRKSSRGPSAPCPYSSPNSSTTAEEEGHQSRSNNSATGQRLVQRRAHRRRRHRVLPPKHIKYERIDDENNNFAGGLAGHDELFLQTVENELRESAPWYIDGSDAETPVADQGDEDNEEPPVTTRPLLQRPPTEDKSQCTVDITSPAARAAIAHFKTNSLQLLVSIQRIYTNIMADSGYKFTDFLKSLDAGGRRPMTFDTFDTFLRSDPVNLH